MNNFFLFPVKESQLITRIKKTDFNTMALQSEIVGKELKAYRCYGFIYVIHGERLFQVDHDYFLELKPGNEVYGSMVRTLKKKEPIAHSELVDVLSKLLNTVKELM